MNKRNVSSVGEVKAGRIEEACSRYSLGRGSMRTVAENAGAIIKIGKCVLINYTKVDAYLDAISGNE